MTALKTISLRIRGYDEETEELSEEYENITGVIADLTKTASKPGGISLFTDSTKDTYRSTYAILKDISEIWDELTDKNQAQLLQKLFGKNRAQVGAAILSNFDTAKDSLIAMTNAAGSADKEMEIIQDSIEYKLNELKQTWVGFAQELVDSGTLGKLIDGLTAISEILQNLSKIPLSGLVTFFGALNVTSLFNRKTGIASLDNEFRTLYDGFRASNNTNFANYVQQFATTTNPFIVQFTNNMDQNTDVLRQWNQQVGQLRTVRLNGLVSSLGGLAKGMAISGAVSLGVTAIYSLINASDKLKESAAKIGSEYKTVENSINSYRKEIISLNETINSETSSVEDVSNAKSRLISIQSEMIDKYGDSQDNLRLIISSTNTEAQSIENINSALDQLNKNEFWDKYAEFNTNNGWEKISQGFNNLIHGSHNNTETMLKEMRDQYVALDIAGWGLPDELKEALKSFDTVVYEDYRETGELIENWSLRGNLQDVYNDLKGIQNLLISRGLAVDNPLFQYISDQAREAYNTLSQYQDYYNAYVLNAEIFPIDDYRNAYKEIIDAKEAYDEAIVSGEGVDEAGKLFQKALSDGIDAAEGNADVVNYFKKMYPELQSVVSKWTFDVDFGANEKTLIQSAKQAARLFSNEGFTVEELSNPNVFKANNSDSSYLLARYDKLTEAAKEYGMSVEELVTLLHDEYGLLNTLQEHEVLQLVGQDIFDKINPSDLNLFNTYSGGLELLKKNMSETDDTAAALDKTLLQITNNLKEPHLDKPEMIELVEDMISGFDKMGDLYKDVLDGKNFKFEDLIKNDFLEAYQYLDGYEEFLETITNYPDNINACQQAFNRLATSYIYANGALEKVTESTEKLTVGMLTTMGITNAQELVSAQLIKNYDGLSDAMEKLEIKGENIADLTEKDVKALYNEGIMAQYAGTALGNYAVKVAYAANCDLTNIDNINYLATLAGTAGIAGGALTKLSSIMAEMATLKEQIENGTAPEGAGRQYSKLYAEAVKQRVEIDEALKEAQVKYGDYGDFLVTDDSSSSSSDKDFDWIKVKIQRLDEEIEKFDEIQSSAFTSFEERLGAAANAQDLLAQKMELQNTAAEKYLELAEQVPLSEEYKELVRNGALNIDTITDEDLRDNIEQYQERYENYIDALKEYRETQQAFLQKTVDEYELTTSEFQRMRDSGAISEKKYLEEMQKAYEYYYKDKIGLENQYKAAVIQNLKDQQSYYDSIASAASSVFDDEINRLQEEQKDRVKPLEEAKKLLEDEVEDLEDAKKHRDQQLATEKALYELRRANNQRDKLVNFMPEYMVTYIKKVAI